MKELSYYAVVGQSLIMGFRVRIGTSIFYFCIGTLMNVLIVVYLVYNSSMCVATHDI